MADTEMSEDGEPRFQLRRHIKGDPLEAIAKCLWASYSKQNVIFNMWFPIDVHPEQQHVSGENGPVVAHRQKPGVQEAIHQCEKRLRTEHHGFEGSEWVYVIDSHYTPSRADSTDDTQGEEPEELVVGCCQWTFYDAPCNPWGDEAEDMLTWICCPAWAANSEGRKVTTGMLRKIFTPQYSWMTGPHANPGWMAVRPEYRQLGIGGMMMAWGISEADQLGFDEDGLECYTTASALSQPLLSRHGFRPIQEITVRVSDNGTPSRKAVKRALGLSEEGYSFTIMWRPARGKGSEEQHAKMWRERRAVYEPNDGNWTIE